MRRTLFTIQRSLSSRPAAGAAGAADSSKAAPTLIRTRGLMSIRVVTTRHRENNAPRGGSGGHKQAVAHRPLAGCVRCHVLEHEDHGMMGQFVVVEPGQDP